MKLAILVCTFALLFLSVAATRPPQPREPLCEKRYEDGMCSKEYSPVCGMDGITYSSECVLCRENKMRNTKVLIKYAGECEAL